MNSISSKSTEALRIGALRNLNILDTPPEPEFDEIARLAARICRTPIALVSLVDRDRVWFKAKVGIDVTEVPRDESVCSEAMYHEGVFVVEDLRQDPRFKDFLYVKTIDSIAYYAGAPLVDREGSIVGALCVLDRKPRTCSQEDADSLQSLAHMVMRILENRQNSFELKYREQTIHELLDFRTKLEFSDEVGAWEFDLSTKRFSWNNQMFKIFGVSEAEFTGDWKSWESAIHRDDFEYFERRIHKSVENCQSIDTRIRVLRPNGSITYVFVRANVVLGLDGNPTKIIGTCWETATITSEEAFNTFYRIALDKDAIVAITDSKGKITYANSMFCKISKYDVTELIGQDHRILNSGKMGKEFFKNMWKTIGSGEQWRGEICNRAKDGSEYWVDTTIVPFVGINGKIEKYVAIRRDITRQKNQEMELKEAYHRAELATNAKSEFLANMSHEIRTPINGIIGFAELMGDSSLSSVQREYLDGIQHSADGLLTIINDILDLSKVEAGKLELEMVDYDLRALMNDILSVQKVAASRRGTSLDGFVSETLPAVMRGDPSRIRQVLLNLVSNAIKFAPGGRVNVRVCEKTDEYNKPWIYFEVTDTGIGIPEGAMSRIFQAFSQADSSTAKRFGGTGLGLSICRKLVDLMDGKIGIESKVGVGSKFWFLIPLEMGEGIAQPAFRQGPGELEPDFRKLRRILVVEDNQMNQKIINGMLKKLGYRSQTVGTGDEAIDALRDFTYDLVLMDCQLPGRDGFDTTRVIRGGAVPDAQDILIVAMTANALKGDREKCLNAGMNDYLAKPVRLAELEFMLDKHLCQMNPALPLAASK